MTHSDGPHVSLLGGDEDRYALWDAAYVLGSLSSKERAEYEAHLGGCASCRAAVSELSGTPALLGLLGREDVVSLEDGQQEPPAMRPELLGSLLTKVSRRRRRERLLTWTVAAAAAAVLVIAVFIGVQTKYALRAPAPPQSTASGLRMAPVTATTLESTMNMVTRSWGTRIEMNCTYGIESDDSDNAEDAGDQLAMVVVTRDGSHSQLATWTALPGVNTSLSGTTSIAANDIAAVQVVSADTGEVFLQRDL